MSKIRKKKLLVLIFTVLGLLVFFGAVGLSMSKTLANINKHKAGVPLSLGELTAFDLLLNEDSSVWFVFESKPSKRIIVVLKPGDTEVTNVSFDEVATSKIVPCTWSDNAEYDNILEMFNSQVRQSQRPPSESTAESPPVSGL